MKTSQVIEKGMGISMNLPEKNQHSQNDNYKEEDLGQNEGDRQAESDNKQDWIDMQMDKEAERDVKGANERKSSANPVTVILLGAILAVLIAVFILLLILAVGRHSTSDDSSEALQQSIMDYAGRQKQQDNVAIDNPGIVNDDFTNAEEPENDTREPEADNSEEEEENRIEYDDEDKTAIVVDVEDESDVSYSKEFILNEMAPYFADNNLEAVWDLAHLKRYVKLSAGLKDTNSYYYLGDVDDKGVPDGIGLAIYENNTYYYGSWSHGMRSGDGRWYRFYIDEIGYKTKKKKYQAHSYSGQWSYDLPNGEGAEHYDVDVSRLAAYERVIQNVVGNFTDGLYDGEMFANTINYQGTVEEWYGTAHKGVFELWRDMSSIGECSVWQNRLETDIYMDIYKSDNKNQGMRELLRNP